MGKLTAVKVRSLTEPGRYSDGDGLFLQVTENGRAWLLRLQVNGRRRDIGLGSLKLRDMDLPFTVHGFRSAFRDWAAEQTDFPGEVAEAALAHSVSNRVEAAYRRTDYLGKRRLLITVWANFCSPG